MGIVHDSRPGDIERFLWSYVPSELRRKKIDLENLEKYEELFTHNFSKVIRSGHEVYRFENPEIGIKSGEYLGYKCLSCEESYFGPTEIKDLPGGETYSACCVGCGVDFFEGKGESSKFLKSFLAALRVRGEGEING